MLIIVQTMSLGLGDKIIKYHICPRFVSDDTLLIREKYG